MERLSRLNLDLPPPNGEAAMFEVCWIVVGLFALVLALTAWLFQQLPNEYTPQEDRGAFFVLIEGPPGATFHYMQDYYDEIEARPWPSPAELLADARELLATADSLVLRDGGEAPTAEQMARLDRELRRIVESQRTTPEDDRKRQDLLARFNAMLQRKFQGVTLQPFGSFVSVFHTAGSDIDVSLEVSPNSNWYDPREMGPGVVAGAQGGRGGGRNRRQQQPRGYKSRKVQLLSKVASELRYQKFADVNLIAHARVPLIKFRDPRTGVKCDVCVGNDGVYKSAVLGAMADLDSRYRDLVFLVKMWAKNFDCNDATAGSFNSYSLSLMSLFHLQTRLLKLHQHPQVPMVKSVEL